MQDLVKAPTSSNQDIGNVFATFFGENYCSKNKKTTLLEFLKYSHKKSESKHMKFVEKLTQIEDIKNKKHKDLDLLEEIIPECSRNEVEELVDGCALNSALKAECILEEFEFISLEHNGLLTARDIQCYPKSLLAKLSMHQKNVEDIKPILDYKNDKITEIDNPLDLPKDIHRSKCPQYDNIDTVSGGIISAKPNTLDRSCEALRRPLKEIEDENENNIQRFYAPLTFKKNPRFINSGDGVETTVNCSGLQNLHAFAAEPKEILFTHFEAGHVFQKTLILRNVSKLTRAVRVSVLQSDYFSISEGQFPEHGSSNVAPGLSCSFIVSFTPNFLSDYADSLEVVYESQLQTLFVPILGRRYRPQINFPNVLDVGACLVGVKKTWKISVRNYGKESSFVAKLSILPKLGANDVEDQSLRITPTQLELVAGRSTDVSVEFTPLSAGPASQLFSVFENGHVIAEMLCKGEGEEVMISFSEYQSMSEVDPWMISNTIMEDGGILATCRLPTQCPGFQVERSFTLANHGTQNLELLCKQHHIQSDNEEAPSGDFLFTLASTVLGGHSSVDSNLKFCANKVGSAAMRVELMVNCVPRCSNEQFFQNSPLRVLLVEVVINVIPVSIYLEPEVLFVAEPTFLSQRIHRTVALINPSENCAISYRWKLEEALSSISALHDAMNEESRDEKITLRRKLKFHVDLDDKEGLLRPLEYRYIKVILSSTTIGHLLCLIPCYLNGDTESPIWLRVEAEIVSPSLEIGVPDVNFGVVQQLMCSEEIVKISNPSSVPLSWMANWDAKLKQSRNAFSMYPMESTVNPKEFSTFSVKFTPKSLGYFKQILEFSVTGAPPKYLRVTGEARLPQLELDVEKIHLDPLYLGVPQQVMVKLSNISVLSSNFNWSMMSCADADWVCVKVTPVNGRLPAGETIQITVECIAQREEPILDLLLNCCVEGVAAPLTLSVLGQTKGLSCTISSLSFEVALNPSDVTLREENGKVVDKTTPSSRGNIIEFAPTGLCMPREHWVEVRNDSALPALVTMAMRMFGCTSARERVVLNGPCPVPLGVDRIRTGCIGDLDWKLANRHTYDYCKSLLSGSKGCTIVPHSYYRCSSYRNENVDKSGHHLITTSNEALHLPPFESLRICLLACADVWGEFRDNFIVSLHSSINNTKEPMQTYQVDFPMVLRAYGSPVEFLTAASRSINEPTFSTATDLRRSQTTSGSDSLCFNEARVEQSASWGRTTGLHLGVTSVISSPIVRKVKMRNTSPFPIRIDWQLYSKLPDPNSEKLLDLCALFGEPFEKLQKNELVLGTSSEQEANGTSLVNMNYSSDERGPMRLVLRPHEGQLIAQSPAARIIESDYSSSSTFSLLMSSMISVWPQQMLIGPGAESQLTVTLDASSSLTGGNVSDTQLNAFALGYLKLEDDMSTEVFRPNPFLSPQLRVNVTAQIKSPRLTLEYTGDDGHHIKTPHCKSAFSNDDGLSDIPDNYFNLIANLDAFLVSEKEVHEALSNSNRPIVYGEFSNSDQLDILDLPQLRVNGKRSSTAKPVSCSSERVVSLKRLDLCNRSAVSIGVRLLIVESSHFENKFFICNSKNRLTAHVKPNRKASTMVVNAVDRLSNLSNELHCVVEPSSSETILIGYLFEKKDFFEESASDVSGLPIDSLKRHWFAKLECRICNAALISNSASLVNDAPPPTTTVHLQAVANLPNLQITSSLLEFPPTLVNQTSTASLQLVNLGPSGETWSIEEADQLITIGKNRTKLSAKKHATFSYSTVTTSTPQLRQSSSGSCSRDSVASINLPKSQIIARDEFIFSPATGFLTASGDIRRGDKIRIEIDFQPRCEGEVEKTFCVIGHLSSIRANFTLRAKGTFDERYDQHFNA